MENATRTAYAALLQTNLFLDLPHAFLQSTTLNEALGINANVTPSNNERCSLKIWVIGSRGHTTTQGTGGQVLLTPIQHKATDGNLYNILPFVLRPVNNDLTADARAKYALRKAVTHGNVPYIAYYGRRIDFTGVQTGMNLVTVDHGVETITPFVPDSSNLNPVPPTTSNTNTNVIDGKYVTATGRITIGMDENEAAEFRNVCNIIYGSENYAMVSEIGLCTAVNRSIQSTDQVSGNQITMNEAIGVQIASHVPSLNAIAFNNNGFELSLDVGVREPLFSVTVVPTTT